MMGVMVQNSVERVEKVRMECNTFPDAHMKALYATARLDFRAFQFCLAQVRLSIKHTHSTTHFLERAIGHFIHTIAEIEGGKEWIVGASEASKADPLDVGRFQSRSFA